MVYVSFSFWLLPVESRDLYQAEKELIACWVEQIHKMISIFTQKQEPMQAVVSSSAWDKWRDPTANNKKLEDM